MNRASKLEITTAVSIAMELESESYQGGAMEDAAIDALVGINTWVLLAKTGRRLKCTFQQLIERERNRAQTKYGIIPQALQRNIDA
jgi:hypothetical protein